MQSLIDHLERWSAFKPEQCLCSFLDANGGERERYTYRSFEERTRGLAEYFTHELGLQFGEPVLLAYPPGLEIVAAFFGCVRIGAIPVPVGPPSRSGLEGRRSRLASIAGDCGAKVALTTRRFLHLAQASAARTTTAARLRWCATDDRVARAPGCAPARTNPVLFLQYTSGSTSDPRGVIVTHDNVLHNARSVIDHAPVGVSWLPQHHDMGLIGYHLFPLVMGGTTFGMAPLDFLRRPAAWLQAISRVRATHASAPNFAFEYCLREDKVPAEQLAGVDLSSLRVLMNAAEPVRADVFRKFFERFAPFGLSRKAHVVAYGLAEHTLAATLNGSRIVTVNKRLLQRGRVRLEADGTGVRRGSALVSCGRPLPGVKLRIVDPESRAVLADGQVGEIWLAGPSVCQGYWRQPALSEQTFSNRLGNDESLQCRYLRTGDLGFLHDGELFVCGRIKDVIIIRGVNYYPQDIEHLVESVSPQIRARGVVALAADGPIEALAIIAEVQTTSDLPQPEAIVHAIRTQYSIVPQTVTCVPAGSIARTTSGKIARATTRRRWLSGELRILSRFDASAAAEQGIASPDGARAHLKRLLEQLAPEGKRHESLAELGIDSLTLVELVELVRASLPGEHAPDWAAEIDVRLLQALSVAELLTLADDLDCVRGSTSRWLRYAQAGHERREQELMKEHARLEPLHLPAMAAGPPRSVLLTGATGFFGPFLLCSLLRKTACRFHVLVRAGSAALAADRLQTALRDAGLLEGDIESLLRERVQVVCGDLSRPKLGLAQERWRDLATQVDAICHNAARVNYLLSYDALRPHNVEATRELLRFAVTGVRKEFHLISSTFIFGWASTLALHESHCNAEMANLDFGYAQSKWVAEQLVFAAQRQGLAARVYRPSLISPSTAGMGSGDDIAVRLLAFMINHGVAVNARNQLSFLPADVAADNIAAIFGLREIDGSTLHVTADGYYSMMDVTRILSRDHGYRFAYHDIPEFVAQMNRRCGKDEPLYPLLEFFNRSHARISRMEHKRYDNRVYRKARHEAGRDGSEPSLEQTVAALVAFMARVGLIDVPARVAATG